MKFSLPLAKFLQMEVRDRIIEEASKQFLKLGIRTVTMDEIAVNLGISKRTVYETFKDKKELIQTCLDGFMVYHERRNNEVIATSANVIEAIFTFLKEGIKAINSINLAFFYDLKKYHSDIWEPHYKASQVNGYNRTYRLLRKGVNEGLFRKDINIPIVARLFHVQINMLTDERFFPPEEYSISEVFSALMINFFRGIATAKGIELIEQLES